MNNQSRKLISLKSYALNVSYNFYAVVFKKASIHSSVLSFFADGVRWQWTKPMCRCPADSITKKNWPNLNENLKYLNYARVIIKFKARTIENKSHQISLSLNSVKLVLSFPKTRFDHFVWLIGFDSSHIKISIWYFIILHTTYILMIHRLRYNTECISFLHSTDVYEISFQIHRIYLRFIIQYGIFLDDKYIFWRKLWRPKDYPLFLFHWITPFLPTLQNCILLRFMTSTNVDVCFEWNTRALSRKSLKYLLQVSPLADLKLHKRNLVHHLVS